MDDLTPMVSCRADEIEIGDQVVNIGTVVDCPHNGEYILIEFVETPAIGSGLYPAPKFGKIYRNNWELVRWAREDEI